MLKRWRRRRAEARSYTAARQAIIEQAAGAESNVADAARTAVVEACAGLLARSFATARVEGPGAPAVTAGLLALIGRQLIVRGEIVLLVDVSDAGLVRLLPAAYWDVDGGPVREDWLWRVDVFGPSGNLTRIVPDAGVAFLPWSVSPAFPWRGEGPLDLAAETGRALGALTTAVADEGQGPRGTILPTPDVTQDTGADDSPDRLASLRADLGRLKGKLALVPTTAGGWGARSEAPRQDWDTVRLGPNPPASIGSLIDETSRSIMAACGTPPDLLVRSDGTTLRESFRRYVHSTVGPLGRMVAEELSAKLEAEVRFSFSSLHASDVQGRARAFAAMVTQGLAMADALDLSGLDDLANE